MDISEVLGLERTIASGNQFYDKGDATVRGHPSASGAAFNILADAKYTERLSYSLRAKELAGWVIDAMQVGRRFILPIRFYSKAKTFPYTESVQDYVVLPLDDFAELLELARGL